MFYVLFLLIQMIENLIKKNTIIGIVLLQNRTYLQ